MAVRLGTFRVSRGMAEMSDGIGQMFRQLGIMSLHSEYDFVTDVYEYWALSPFFRDLEEDEVVPEYIINATARTVVWNIPIYTFGAEESVYDQIDIYVHMGRSTQEKIHRGWFVSLARC